METRNCGRDGLKLSLLGLGCWEFGGGDYWGQTSQRDADAVVARALASGINYFDTAEAYNDGRSETALGAALKPFPRHRAVIGSKISPSHCYPGEITRRCEASLARLQTDYIDLYMLHWPINPVSLQHFSADPAVTSRPPRLDEALEEFRLLRQAGKIRHFGVSNFGAQRLDELAADTPIMPAANELPYNLLSRAIEFSAVAACRRHRLGIIGYMTLMQGVLGKALNAFDELEPQLRRTRHFDSRKNALARHGGHGAEPTLRQTLTDLRRLAAELGCALPELAIRWVTSNPDIACALVGSRNPDRLAANAAAVAVPLPADAVAELNRITAPLQQELGPCLDYYESVANDRT